MSFSNGSRDFLMQIIKVKIMMPLVLGVVLKHPQVVLTVEFSGMLPKIPQTSEEKYSKSSNSANFKARNDSLYLNSPFGGSQFMFIMLDG